MGGRYELGELLGRGGMAEVRKGNDIRLGRVVAVKRLRTDLASDSTFQARFRREAQSSASLNHPSIVAVYDTGEEMSTDGSEVAQPYIVMEYVAGRTLRDIIREGRKILPERALEITAGVLSALDYSHRAGIIHRDIKPGNVMLTPSGSIKVMDFGIARAISDASSAMTQTAAVVGTAQYLSPEQARGETVDSRSDVYSTGCLLYELLTGRPPFVGESPVSVAYQHVREQAQPPSSLDDELTPEIDAIVMKSLAKRVEDRYQSAAAMKADIDRCLAGKPVQAPIIPTDDSTSFLPHDTPPSESTAVYAPVAQQEDEEEGRKKWPLVLLGLAILALLVAAAIIGPKLLGGAPPQTSVPTLVQMNVREATRVLEDKGLQMGNITREANEDVPKGLIISQNPQPMDFVSPGDAVDVTVSTGKPDRVVPYLIGQDKDTAQAKLEEQGLKARIRFRKSDSPKDQVVAMNPDPATSVSVGTVVTLFVSEGPRQVPLVIGMTESRAKKVLSKRGFNVSVVDDSTTPAEPGTVLDQSPEAYTEHPQGTTVTITVSTYQPPPSESPTPTESTSPSPSPSPTVVPQRSGSPTASPSP